MKIRAKKNICTVFLAKWKMCQTKTDLAFANISKAGKTFLVEIHKNDSCKPGKKLFTNMSLNEPN